VQKRKGILVFIVLLQMLPIIAFSADDTVDEIVMEEVQPIVKGYCANGASDCTTQN